MRTALAWPSALVAALFTATPLLATASEDTAPPAATAAAKPQAAPAAAKQAAATGAAAPAASKPPGTTAPAAAKPAGASGAAGASAPTAAKPAASGGSTAPAASKPTAAGGSSGASAPTAAKPAASGGSSGAAAPTAAKPAASGGSTAPAAAKPAASGGSSGAAAPTAAKPAASGGSTAPAAAKPTGAATAPGAAKPVTPTAAGTAGSATPTAAGAPKPAAGAAAAGAASQTSAPVDPAGAHLTLAQATFGLKGTGAIVATIEITSEGKPAQALHCELYADKAPLAVANFVALGRGLRQWKDPKTGQWVKKPLYDGNLLHRVIPELLIQGGDPNCTGDPSCRGAPGVGDPGYTIVDEIRPELRFDRAGRLAMSGRGPNTGGSQFFVTEREAPWLTGSNTIFGQCDGAELVAQLARVETGSRDVPKAPLTIKRIFFARKGN